MQSWVTLANQDTSSCLHVPCWRNGLTLCKKELAKLLALGTSEIKQLGKEKWLYFGSQAVGFRCQTALCSHSARLWGPDLDSDLRYQGSLNPHLPLQNLQQVLWCLLYAIAKAWGQGTPGKTPSSHVSVWMSIYVQPRTAHDPTASASHVSGAADTHHRGQFLKKCSW